MLILSSHTIINYQIKDLNLMKPSPAPPSFSRTTSDQSLSRLMHISPPFSTISLSFYPFHRNCNQCQTVPGGPDCWGEVQGKPIATLFANPSMSRHHSVGQASQGQAHSQLHSQRTSCEVPWSRENSKACHCPEGNLKHIWEPFVLFDTSVVNLLNDLNQLSPIRVLTQ